MHPEYFKTHFRQKTPFSDWPEKFSIITAYATTGQTWTNKQNIPADRRLEAELRTTGLWLRRLIGYSPTTGHREFGWAVEMAWREACEIGLHYRQDAIYFVNGDELSVTLCDERRKLTLVGDFRERLQS